MSGRRKGDRERRGGGGGREEKQDTRTTDLVTLRLA